MKKSIFMLTVSLLILLSACNAKNEISAGTDSIRADKSPAIPETGNQSTNNLDVLIENVSVSTQDAEQGYKYVDIVVALINSAEEPEFYNPTGFRLMDSNKNIYDLALNSAKPSLKQGYLFSEEQARGHIAFQIPVDAEAMSIQYLGRTLNLFPTAGERPVVSTNDFSSATIEYIGDITVVVDGKIPFSGENTQEGFSIVDYEITIINNGTEPYLYSSRSFLLKDSKGYQYNAMLEANDPSITYGELGAGESTTGHLAFEILDGADGLILIFEPVDQSSAEHILRIYLD